MPVNIVPLTPQRLPDLAALFGQGRRLEVVLVSIAGWPRVGRYCGWEMDDLDRTISALCQFPVDFRDSALNLSAVQLVANYGYPSVAEQITVDRVAAYLATRPNLVDEWFHWSEDQRWSPAWWISDRAPGEYRVGYYDPDAGGPRESLIFHDRVRACAEFALRVVASIDRNGRQGGDHG